MESVHISSGFHQFHLACNIPFLFVTGPQTKAAVGWIHYLVVTCPCFLEETLILHVKVHYLDDLSFEKILLILNVQYLGGINSQSSLYCSLLLVESTSTFLTQFLSHPSHRSSAQFLILSIP